MRTPSQSNVVMMPLSSMLAFERRRLWRERRKKKVVTASVFLLAIALGSALVLGIGRFGRIPW